MRNDGFDLVRASAAGLVFATHLSHDLDQAWLGPIALGGWNGVYMFFVLSGFLLYQPFLEGPVNLRRYAVARLARIMPAYYLAVAVLMVTGIAFNAGPNPWPVLTFTSILFPDDAAIGSFGHSWTLSVEMAFYLALPVVAWLARDRVVRLAWLAVASVVLYFAFPGVWPLSFLSSFWGFAVGMLAARYRQRIPSVWPLGLGLVLYGVTMTGLYNNIAGPTATVMGTGLLLVWADRRRPTIPWARWPAAISYGFYLWHVPVLFWLARGLGFDGLPLIVLGLAGTVTIAGLSWELFERPVLRRLRQPIVKQRLEHPDHVLQNMIALRLGQRRPLLGGPNVEVPEMLDVGR